MRGLYEIYLDRAKPELLGHLWLYQRDLESMRQQGHVRVLVDDDWPLEVSPAGVDPTYKLETLTLWLDRGRDRAWRIYTDAKKEQLDKAKKAQEQNLRFPVPILLLPG